MEPLRVETPTDKLRNALFADVLSGRIRLVDYRVAKPGQAKQELLKVLSYGVEFGMAHSYERDGVYSVDQVHGNLGEHYTDFNGHPIWMGSSRYRLFAKSTRCVKCGIDGSFYLKERSAKRDPATKEWVSLPDNEWHLNLYARRQDGKDVLMTKDHIHPRSKGGANADENYQTMCQPCNGTKSDRTNDGVTTF